jgi:hypothetical protein
MGAVGANLTENVHLLLAARLLEQVVAEIVKLPLDTIGLSETAEL